MSAFKIHFGLTKQLAFFLKLRSTCDGAVRFFYAEMTDEIEGAHLYRILQEGEDGSLAGALSLSVCHGLPASILAIGQFLCRGI